VSVLGLPLCPLPSVFSVLAVSALLPSRVIKGGSTKAARSIAARRSLTGTAGNYPPAAIYHKVPVHGQRQLPPERYRPQF
jgi:hypothetical protein